MKTDKSRLIEQLEWALVKAKYSPNANFNEIAEHLDCAQSLVKDLTISDASQQRELLREFMMWYETPAILNLSATDETVDKFLSRNGG